MVEPIVLDDEPVVDERAAEVVIALRSRAARERGAASELSRRITHVSLARLAMVATILVAGAEAIAHPRHQRVLAVATMLAIAVFARLVWFSHRLVKRRQSSLGRARVSEQAAYRAECDWPHVLPQPWTWPTDGGEPLRIDLDVVGSASLTQLLPAISAGIGAPRMRDWLSGIVSPEEIGERQASVRELVDAVDLRDAFELYARGVNVSPTRVAEFVAWGRSRDGTEPFWLATLSRVLPIVTIGSICAGVLWRAATPVAASLALLSITATMLVAATVRSRTDDSMQAAEIAAGVAEAYAELGALVLRARFATPRLQALQRALGDDPSTYVDRALNRLRRLSDWAEVRSSPMMHAVLQGLFAWDCQIARAVDNWRATHGQSLGVWFDAFAEIECTAALAGLAYTNPSWTFPNVALPSPLRVEARGLAHPLLRPNVRIANDVEIGPPGTLLLISGSNMSGKSTLLRAIGLNLLLARTGGPVCAEAMSCPPVRLMTSLRVQDSLADGMSYFMAEALRLRDIIFAAEASVDETLPPVLYLVDELLRGTNSEERSVATGFIVARLLETPAIGIITTHDLGMFDGAEIAPRVRHAHFAEKFSQHADGERLVFDYRLRQGPTISTNALRLLALIGLTPASAP